MASSAMFHVVMTVVSLVFLVPLIWMVLSSFKSQEEIFDKPWSLPERFDFSIWGDAWQRGGLGTYVINSIIVTTVSVVAILLFGAMAGFALSRLKFRMR